MRWPVPASRVKMDRCQELLGQRGGGPSERRRRFAGGRGAIAVSKFLLGVLVGIIFLPIVAFFFIWFGYAPVATATPPLPFERKLAALALDARISREAPAGSPVPASEENLLAGARIYQNTCDGCHGTIEGPKSPMAAGMYPSPPLLLQKGKGVTDDPVGMTYWKVTNGIRLTGMPAFGGALGERSRWQVSQLLKNANHLPESVKALLAPGPPAK